MGEKRFSDLPGGRDKTESLIVADTRWRGSCSLSPQVMWEMIMRQTCTDHCDARLRDHQRARNVPREASVEPGVSKHDVEGHLAQFQPAALPSGANSSDNSSGFWIFARFGSHLTRTGIKASSRLPNLTGASPLAFNRQVTRPRLRPEINFARSSNFNKIRFHQTGTLSSVAKAPSRWAVGAWNC